jgi:phosphatidylglycerophosphate synthase
VGRNGMALIKTLLWPNNLVTLSRMVVVTGLVAIANFGQHLPAFTGPILFVAAYWATDHIDGWLARRLNKTSLFGEALDLIVDRWCDVLIAVFLLRATPQHAAALTIFLLLRIAPEIVVGRYAGRTPSMFIAVGTRLIGQWLANLSVDLALMLRTAFFAWALYGEAPVWSGIALIVPALIFASMIVWVLTELAGDANQTG